PAPRPARVVHRVRQRAVGWRPGGHQLDPQLVELRRGDALQPQRAVRGLAGYEVGRQSHGSGEDERRQAGQAEAGPAAPAGEPQSLRTHHYRSTYRAPTRNSNAMDESSPPSPTLPREGEGELDKG